MNQGIGIVLLIGLGCGAMAILLVTLVQSRRRDRNIASLEDRIQSVFTEARQARILAERQIARIIEIGSAATHVQRIMDGLQQLKDDLQKLSRLQPAGVDPESKQILADVRQATMDLQTALRQLFSNRDAKQLSLQPEPQTSAPVQSDGAVPEVWAELLRLLENDGRQSTVARLSGLNTWLAERMPEMKVFPLLSSDDLWLAIVLSIGDSNEGTVLPTLDTVIGAGEIADWFECLAYDGTTPLHAADVVKPGSAVRDPATGKWRVASKGLIKRIARKESA